MLDDKHRRPPNLGADNPECSCAAQGIARHTDEACPAMLPGQWPVVQQRLSQLVTPLVTAELFDAGWAKQRVERRGHSKQDSGAQ